MIFLFKVFGHSMEPLFREGDYVLVMRLFDPKKGDVVVIVKNGKKMLKRLSSVSRNNYTVLSDNHGTDSLAFGPLNRREIIGKVIWSTKS